MKTSTYLFMFEFFFLVIKKGKVYYKPIRRAKVQNTETSNIGEAVKQRVFLLIADGVQMDQTLWRTAGQLLPSLNLS